MPLKIELSKDEIQLVVNALAELPYKHVNHVIPKILAQVSGQVGGGAPAEVPAGDETDDAS